MAVLTAIGCVLFVSSLQALPNSHNLICLKNKQCIKVVRTAATSLSKFWKWQKNGFKTWAVKKQNVRMKTYLSRSLRAHQPGPLSRFSNGKTFYCKHKVLFATLFSNIGFFSLERTHSTEKSAIGGGGKRGRGQGCINFTEIQQEKNCMLSIRINRTQMRFKGEKNLKKLHLSRLAGSHKAGAVY